MKKNELDEIRENSDGKTTNSDEVSVKYEMLVDTKIQSTLYTKITKNVMKDEKEILFSMEFVFRIAEVNKRCDRMYCVKLRTKRTEDELTAHLD
jgi:hypothetical protein